LYFKIEICFSVRFILALTSSSFMHHADNNWCATIGKHSGSTSLYESYWTNKHYYVCQYDCKYSNKLLMHISENSDFISTVFIVVSSQT